VPIVSIAEDQPSRGLEVIQSTVSVFFVFLTMTWLTDGVRLLRWLYCMHIAQDANFRLNNRARKGKANDPPLQPGSAYMVSAQEVYDYIKNFVDEKEVSFCDLHRCLVLTHS
jgi:hypothetical protein